VFMKPEGLGVSFSVSFLLVKASPVAVLPGVDLPRSAGRGHRGADQSRHPLALVERTDPIARTGYVPNWGNITNRVLEVDRYEQEAN